jgi:cholesterol transport system auxiliary component
VPVEGAVVQWLSGEWGGSRAAIAVVFTLMMAGCSGVTGGGAPSTFDLTAPDQFPRAVRPPRALLLVQDATAVGVLDSDKVVVRPTEAQIATLGGAQWSERLTRLVQVRMIEAFENAKRMRGVGRPGDRISADYQLMLDIRAFEIDVANNQAEVTIAAKIAGDRSGRIVSGRVFTARVPARETQGPGAVAALDSAFHQVATEIVIWVSKII